MYMQVDRRNLLLGGLGALMAGMLPACKGAAGDKGGGASPAEDEAVAVDFATLDSLADAAFSGLPWEADLAGWGSLMELARQKLAEDMPASAAALAGLANSAGVPMLQFATDVSEELSDEERLSRAKAQIDTFMDGLAGLDTESVRAELEAIGWDGAWPSAESAAFEDMASGVSEEMRAFIVDSGISDNPLAALALRTVDTDRREIASGRTMDALLDTLAAGAEWASEVVTARTAAPGSSARAVAPPAPALDELCALWGIDNLNFVLPPTNGPVIAKVANDECEGLLTALDAILTLVGMLGAWFGLGQALLAVTVVSTLGGLLLAFALLSVALVTICSLISLLEAYQACVAS